MPTAILNKCAGRLRYPPANAIGAERIANGQNNSQRKCPARQNCHEPIDATRIFNTSAVGLISAGASPNSVITAMYPDAPACPTDE